MFKKIAEWWQQRQLKKYKEWYNQQRELIKTVKSTVTRYILNKEPALLEAVAKQTSILKHNDRRPVAIFISEKTYKNILRACVTPTENALQVFEVVKELQEPVGTFGDMPIYVSPLMKKAPIFVVGEITWELRNTHEDK